MDYDFKKEEDVKEFLDKLGVEYRFSCFSENRPDSCQLLGEYLETIKKDYDKAMKVYKNNCDENNHPKSCFRYGFLSLKGKGNKQSREEGSTYFEKGCKAGEAQACTTGGMMVMMDAAKAEQQQEEMINQGLAMVSRGCDLNNSYACYHLSALYIAGSPDHHIAQDMKQGFKYSEKACQLGCIFACGNLSQMYRKGEGVEKDLNKAEFFKAKTMDMQAQYNQAIKFQRGGK